MTRHSCSAFLLKGSVVSLQGQPRPQGEKQPQSGLSQIPLADAKIPQPEGKEIRDTLASVRLDSVISSGFRISRGLAAEYIHAGKVAVDGLPCEKPDKTVAEGAKISLRGSGKIMLHQVGQLTKKGRISVVIHRYV